MKTTLLLLLLTLTLPPLAARGQAPDPTRRTAQLEAMRRLEALVGTWQGDGWIRTPDGSRQTFHSRETVEARLDGLLLIVEGLHQAPRGGGGTLVPVHHALGIITYDDRAGAYRFRTQLASGEGGDFTLEVTDDGFVWGYDTDRGAVRYTATVTDDRWTETGHFSADGEAWRPFFEMSLTRTE